MNTTVAEHKRKLETFEQWVEYIQKRGVIYNSWDEVINDSDLQDFPGKIEFCDGELLLSPSPTIEHNDLQRIVFELLKEYTKILQLKGTALFPPAVGEDKLRDYREPDTGWTSWERHELAKKDNVFSKAPEICVEIDSPANKKDSKHSFEVKKAFYFEHGALEVWLGNQYTRVVKFYERQNPDKELDKSIFVPDFPAEIPKSAEDIEQLILDLQVIKLKKLGKIR